MVEFVSIAGAAALVWKVVSWVKQLSAGHFRAALTQGVAWVAGVGVAFLLYWSDFSLGVDLGGFALADAATASVVLFGLYLGSLASATYDVKKALDTSDSSVEPDLGGTE